jgi:hypothetical protein
MYRISGHASQWQRRAIWSGLHVEDCLRGRRRNGDHSSHKTHFGRRHPNFGAPLACLLSLFWASNSSGSSMTTSLPVVEKANERHDNFFNRVRRVPPSPNGMKNSMKSPPPAPRSFPSQSARAQPGFANLVEAGSRDFLRGQP